MTGYSGTMHYRLTILAKYEGSYGFTETTRRVEEIMDEARSKLAALGYETDVIIREDDGSTPSPAEAALDEEERRRKRSKEIRAKLSELNDTRSPEAERERQAVQEALKRAFKQD